MGWNMDGDTASRGLLNLLDVGQLVVRRNEEREENTVCAKEREKERHRYKMGKVKLTLKRSFEAKRRERPAAAGPSNY